MMIINFTTKFWPKNIQGTNLKISAIKYSQK